MSIEDAMRFGAIIADFIATVTAAMALSIAVLLFMGIHDPESMQHASIAFAVISCAFWLIARRLIKRRHHEDCDALDIDDTEAL